MYNTFFYSALLSLLLSRTILSVFRLFHEHSIIIHSNILVNYITLNRHLASAEEWIEIFVKLEWKWATVKAHSLFFFPVIFQSNIYFYLFYDLVYFYIWLVVSGFICCQQLARLWCRCRINKAQPAHSGSRIAGVVWWQLNFKPYSFSTECSPVASMTPSKDRRSYLMKAKASFKRRKQSSLSAALLAAANTCSKSDTAARFILNVISNPQNYITHKTEPRKQTKIPCLYTKLAFILSKGRAQHYVWH